MEYSREFHGTTRSSNQMITEFHGIPWNFQIAILNDMRFPCTAMEYSMEFHGTLEYSVVLKSNITEGHGIPWNSENAVFMVIRLHWNSMEFHGTRRAPFKMIQGSMEFYGIFHGIPWNYDAAKSNLTALYGILWNYQIDISNYMRFPRTSMHYSMAFHGTLESPNQISPSSNISNDTRVPLNSMEYSMEYYMEFHETLVSPLSLTSVFLGLPFNSMELGGFHLNWHRVPWNSMEYSMKFHGTMMPPNQISSSSTEFYVTFRLSF